METFKAKYSILVISISGFAMKLRGIKTTTKRRSESLRAKRQQQGRRGETLFKTSCEYSAGCDAEVYLCVKIKRNGQIVSLTRKNNENGCYQTSKWYVTHFLDLVEVDTKQNKHYPTPIQLTSKNLQGPKEGQKHSGKPNGSDWESGIMNFYQSCQG